MYYIFFVHSSIDGENTHLLFTFVNSAAMNIQFSSVTKSCSTLCDPMDCSMQGLPLHDQLLELTTLILFCHIT